MNTSTKTLRLRGTWLLMLLLILLTAFFVLGQGKVKRAQSHEQCDETLLQPTQIECFLGLAKAEDRPALCELARDPVVRFHCLSLYAEQTLDPSPCGRIVAVNGEALTLQESCISGVAMARRDPALCDRVTTGEIRDSCYMMLVVQFGASPENCDKIHNSILKSSCQE